ncbi:DcaP family trimeric outer membrane transporter [Microbulbifer sp. OS29]|uniref:DcaP family trimeric outer membrane transporter n=1 Tax=Microbulbifer okhotskensis TaxID=2926617 RepID=A0A9X2J5K6_9GAMM|nr:DcaP family trimeric outer membrane transporter [Microbulbifer okhotskensis]MCO1334499.1 DcaP family trimeric outer membrane transporter [Microbulbifer okhotskensis]
MEINAQSPMIPAAVIGITQLLFAELSTAEVYVKADDLIRVIEAQQQQLEEQEAQIQRQKADLEALRKQVEKLHRARPSPSPPQAPPSQDPPPQSSEAPVNEQDLDELHHQIEQLRRDIPSNSLPPPRAKFDQAVSEQSDIEAVISSAATDWPGSIPLLGSAMKVKISGYADLDANYDTDALVSPAQFVPADIVTFDKTAAEGADGQTSFTVQTSRILFETKTPWNGREFKTIISMDFLQDPSVTTPNPRMRKAYGEVSNVLWGGSVLVGQDWTTFADLVAIPNTLDFQGPNSVIGLRHSMVRWHKQYGPQYHFKVAIEAPDSQIFEEALEVARWPDTVFVLVSETGQMHLQAGLVLRDLRASGDPDSAVSTTGWGFNLSGTFNMPGALSQDLLSYSVSFGEGYSGLLNDAPPDAAYDIYNNSLEALPTSAWYLGYQHWWTPCLYTVATYGRVRQKNYDFQPGISYKKTQYRSINLTWTPFPRWLVGIEALYGVRQDKNGDRGSLWRTQFTTRVTF